MRGGHGLEADGVDLASTRLTKSVGALIELADRTLDVFERVLEDATSASASLRSAVTWLESAKFES